MKKTSVYLTEAEIERLKRLARQEGVSQAQVIRDAVTSYAPRTRASRDFALARSGRGPGGSIADIPEEELIEGFGE
ncbi:MAG: CopG family transcriptional regulator [Actinomycetota bacterium]